MIQGAVLSGDLSPESSFCDRLALLLARINCRLATSGEQREEIFRLRYAAGMRDPEISRHSSRTFSDSYDNAGNLYLLGLYMDGELASSIRLHIAFKDQHQFPSREVFADVLRSKLDAGQIIIDCTRFVADEHLSQLYPELPYATLRCCMLAAEHFDADYLIIAAKSAHQTFYRHAFNYKAISGPRFCPRIGSAVRLMALNYATAADDLYRRYPFFCSTPAERRKLFDKNKSSPVAS